jgi:hypothetical protein
MFSGHMTLQPDKGGAMRVEPEIQAVMVVVFLTIWKTSRGGIKSQTSFSFWEEMDCQ